MKFSVHTTERMEDQIADQGIIPDKLTGEESGEEESGDEETEDSGSASEWRPGIEILFRQPIYSSNTSPQFPQELIERICEFLWDEPVQLAVSCTRICPAWYHAARRVLPEYAITCRTQEALRDYAHTLTSLRNAPYRKQFKKLWISDNASKPFAHVWPICIPGWILPKLRYVELVTLDWSTKTPHDSFFIYLSSYTSVSCLILRDCRFRSLPDLRRVINALPNLMSLELYNITLQHPLRPGSVPDYITLRARSHRLESIYLRGSKHRPEYSDVSSEYQGTTALGSQAQALLHMVVANSSTVTRLDLDLRFFTSLSALQRCLAHFRRLTSFEARYQFASGPMITLEETVPARTENTYIHSWESFTLTDVPDQSALQLLQLLATPRSCSKLHELRICLAGRPSAALLSRTSRFLHESGHRLKDLWWECSVDTDLEVIPSLAGNTTLQTLYINLRDIAPSPQKIHSALTAILSDIVSVDLRKVYIHLTLARLEVLPQNHGRTPVAPDPAEAISAFHIILSREIFNGLPLHTHYNCVEVDFYVGNIQDNPVVVATIKAYMITLFTPWLDRGIVELRFNWMDSVETITCVSTSMLNEDTLSDRGGEDVEENTPVGTEQYNEAQEVIWRETDTGMKGSDGRRW
ncbi:uncharacterized protein C8Q71DRAFT_861490 [Rhodofomes roseus]|uniref:F-box domain-containing protein n=1 Tax=Rhodofomes roseus TaxID=34475 RepID=A0ABQ8K4P2_9APHY|nr:uncharacterized protein C8Q71DRAFT_861490 [Rhodofomes roseus]KAH9831812.1 hypothetical protein C8Q71DRAFT_861490 [Rhodofomes roseus]